MSRDVLKHWPRYSNGVKIPIYYFGPLPVRCSCAADRRIRRLPDWTKWKMIKSSKHQLKATSVFSIYTATVDSAHCSTMRFLRFFSKSKKATFYVFEASYQTRKPCCRKETARCRKCSFLLKFANNIHYKYKTIAKLRKRPLFRAPNMLTHNAI